MYQHTSFFVQLILYFIIMYCARIHLSADDIRLQGLHVRTVVGVLQVLVLLSMFSIHSFFSFLIRLLKRDRKKFVLVDLVTPEPTNNADSSNVDDAQSVVSRQSIPITKLTQLTSLSQLKSLSVVHPSHQNVDTDSARSVHSNASLKVDIQDLEECLANTQETQETVPDTFNNNIAAIDSISCHTEKSDDVSIGTDLRHSIVFDDSSKLDWYVFYILCLGGILWSTFMCFNFATANTSTSFVSGIVCGYAAHNIVEYWSTKRSYAVICWVSVYLILYVSILSLCWDNLIPVHNPDMFMVCMMYFNAFSCGFFWTALGGEIAFHGTSSVDHQGIYYDTRRAVPVCIIVMCVSGLSVAPETRIVVWDYLQDLSRLATLHLLCIEPMLKFVSIYMMVITLERKRTVDFVTALIIVHAVHVVLQKSKPTYTSHDIGLLVCAAMLLGVHVTFVLRHSFRKT